MSFQNFCGSKALKLKWTVSFSALVLFCLLGVAVKPQLSVANPNLVDVQPKLETRPLFDDDAGGSADADDPAIWLHPTQSNQSLVIVTKKNAGLSVYDLQGKQVQSIAAPSPPRPTDAPGRFNNVDIVYGFQLRGRTVDLAVTTDRGSDKLRIYEIDPTRIRQGLKPLLDITDSKAGFIFSKTQAQVNNQTTAYGLALHRDRKSGKTLAFVSQRERTTVAQLELIDAGQGKVGYRQTKQLVLPKRFTLPNGKSWIPCGDPGELPQVEGMVADEALDILYLGQEDVGIWKVSIKTFGLVQPVLIDRVREYGVPYTYDTAEEECVLDTAADPGFGGKHLTADVEGLTIYYATENQGYLLASSQGDNTFAVYSRGGGINRYLGSFALTKTKGVDSVEESDGAAVLNVRLGSAFPYGLLVTQDGDNTPAVLDGGGEPRDNTNFKFTPWQAIARAFPKPLAVNPFGWDPRSGYRAKPQAPVGR
jgi:3-phytase